MDPLPEADKIVSLETLVALIEKKSPLQKKRIRSFLQGADARYMQSAEKIVQALFGQEKSGSFDHNLAIRSYCELCAEMLRQQIRFMKTGTYPCRDSKQALDDIYSVPDVMRPYILGLLLSYLFWPNHYAMYRFFQDLLQECDCSRVLEVGAGHGLFTAEIAAHSGNDITVVDISSASLAVTHEILEKFGITAEKMNLVLGDFLQVSLNEEGFSLIVMGEVLEHVDEAPAFLKRAQSQLSPGGKIFISTCANSPAHDHVWHFQNADAIRVLLNQAGLVIRHELVLPSEALPEEKWEESRITINYAAILEAR